MLLLGDVVADEVVVLPLAIDLQEVGTRVLPEDVLIRVDEETGRAAGRIADRVDKRVQIVIGLFVLGISVAAIPFASRFPALLLISSFLALGMSLSTVATSTYVADVAKEEQMGASMGALSSIMDIGHSAGPLVTGIIVAAGGFGPGFFASFLLAVAVCGFFALSVRDRAPEGSV